MFVTNVKDAIDEIFDELEDRINCYIEQSNEKGLSLHDEQLQKKLEQKERECEESKQACIEVATKLRHTILMMSNVLSDAN